MRFYLEELLQKMARAGLAGLGRSGSSRLSMSLDLTDVINSMNFLSSVGEAISKESKEGMEAHQSAVDFMYVTYLRGISRAIRGNEDLVAHVYEWSSVVDYSTAIPGDRNQRNSIDDTSTSVFQPSINTKEPLWRLRAPSMSGRSYVSEIMFVSNTKPALYDKRVYTSTRNRQSGFASHHFRDQAAQLEGVQRIIKRSKNVSKRRTGGSSTFQAQRKSRGGMPKTGRIVQLTESVSTAGRFHLVNYENYQRQNRFYRQFAKFYLSWATSGEQQKLTAVKNLRSIFTETMESETQRLLQAQSRMVATGIASGRMATIGDSVRFRPGAPVRIDIQFTNKGQVIKNMPLAAPVYRDRIATEITKKIVDRTNTITTNDVQKLMGAPKKGRAAMKLSAGRTSKIAKSVRTSVKGQTTSVQGAYTK